MKAEERKEIETNSLILNVQRLRQKMSGHALYYVVGTAILVTAGILLYRYFANESRKARDAVLQQLTDADTPEKLKEGMEANRGTIVGSEFKLHLARHLLLNEGLPKLGTESTEARKQAASSIEQARTYYLELTTELKEKEEPAMLQEAWLYTGKAEESLIGLTATPGGTDYRGNIDKAIEYYDKAGSIFSDKDFSKRYKERADFLKANKDKVVAEYKEMYKAREFVLPPLPGKSDPFPGFPPSGPKLDIPPPPPAPTPDPEPKKTSDPKPGDPKIDVPAIPSPPVDSKKTPDPKPVDPKGATPPSDPKKTPDPKPSDPAKTDPKAK